MFSDAVNDEVADTQLNVLSVAPLIVIPPPSAVVSEGVATSAIMIFLSSTTRLVEFKFVVVPLTVRFPDRVKSTAVTDPLASTLAKTVPLEFCHCCKSPVWLAALLAVRTTADACALVTISP